MSYHVSLEGAAIDYYLKRVKPRPRRRTLVDAVLRDLERDALPRDFRLPVSREEADSLRFVFQHAAAPSTLHPSGGIYEIVAQSLSYALSARLAIFMARVPVYDPARLLPRLFWQKPLHVIRLWYYEDPDSDTTRRQVFCMRVRP